jgi:glycosyltransferase involved in cell wall biosynthesis
MKVVFIIPFPPQYEYKNGREPDFYWLNQNYEKVCVWRTDWGHVFARDVKRFFPEIEYEVWRLDYRAQKEYVHRFEDGVIHRSFPAQIKYYRSGLKVKKSWTSNELIEKLEKEVQLNKHETNTVVHRSVDFNFFSNHILNRFFQRIPFLLTSHLNPNLLIPEISTIHPLKYLHRKLIKKQYKRHINLFENIAVSEDRLEFFKRNTRANVYPHNNLNFDFEWAKNKISKVTARRKLGLDQDVFIIFSSSRIVPEKQLDKMLKCLSEIKDRKFICIISGAGEIQYENYLKNMVQELCIDSKVFFVGFLSDTLIDYYCAADLFISTSGSESGPVSAIKAMALGNPLMSTDTGMAAYLLKQHNAGIILNKKDHSQWAKKIIDVIDRRQIDIIDPLVLEKKYGIENSTKQLVQYYQQAIKNFQKSDL